MHMASGRRGVVWTLWALQLVQPTSGDGGLIAFAPSHLLRVWTPAGEGFTPRQTVRTRTQTEGEGQPDLYPYRGIQSRPRWLASPCVLAMAADSSKKRSKGTDGGRGGASPAKMSETALIAKLRATVAEVGNGFDALGPDLERVAALLGDLEDYNGG